MLMVKSNFTGLMIRLSSPETILSNSKWIITSPDTVNYRTGKAKEWWLFCEKIFWPVKNYECSCWKHKWVRYKWVICDRCWVEVTTSRVRRERMWHIFLYANIVHVWYFRASSSIIGLMLNLSSKEIEKVVNFVKYVVIDVNESQKHNVLKILDKEFHNKILLLNKEYDKAMNWIEVRSLPAEEHKKRKEAIDTLKAENEKKLKKEFSDIKSRIKTLVVWSTIKEVEYNHLFYRYEWVFTFKTWSDALLHMMKNMDLEKIIHADIEKIMGLKWKQREDEFKRLQLLVNLYISWVKPTRTILSYLPVIPADLRPIVQLEWWKFVSSDINIFYRRVLMRNIRLKKMIEAWMPDVIKKNETRLLQEAVNNLIIWEKNTQWSWAWIKVYKSLTDILIWKEWRFRKNLLWKRVDYSWRSVITVWPDLQLDECWVPLYVAVRMFTPFIISKLLKLKYAHTPKQAEKYIKEENPIALEVLKEVIKDKYVLLNRAPTLHRLWIQAFKIKLMPWKTIRIHPLVCTAFNADFDGDQMWLHLPLSIQAQKEAKEIMCSTKNIIKPWSWDPIITHTQDMVLWVYYLTDDQTMSNEIKWFFGSIEDVIVNFNGNNVAVKDKIILYYNGEKIETTVWRVIFNELLPEEMRFFNKTVTKKEIVKILDNVYEFSWWDKTVEVADKLKNIWFKYATLSSTTMNVFDLEVPDIKQKLLTEGDEKVRIIHNAWYKWLVTNDEKHRTIITIWDDIKTTISDKMKPHYQPWNSIFTLIDSWARWNRDQLTQLSWMKWLVANPKWDIIELPIKSAIIEWFSPIEYFISAHGARKWKADTALKTAESWYLTRRLVDATQDMVVRENDCWVQKGLVINKDEVELRRETFFDVIYGRTLEWDLVDVNGKLLLEKWIMILKKHKFSIDNADIEFVKVRTPLTCRSVSWVCQKCFGLDLASRKIIAEWTAIWVISSQSIWEPGTQLTMRTFHTWWAAQLQWDITQGIKRVEELFEIIKPKMSAVVSFFDWKVELMEEWKYMKIKVSWEVEKKVYMIKAWYTVCVKKWEELKKGAVYAIKWNSKLKVWDLCTVTDIKNDKITVWINNIFEKEVPVWFGINVKNWDQVYKWQLLSSGVVDIKEYRDIVWELETQKYIVKEVKKVYVLQWQDLNDKYIEIIVKNLFSKFIVEDSWDSSYIPWCIARYEEVENVNEKIKLEWGKMVGWKRLILWLTQIAKQTESWLSSASFQETMRVLVNASIRWDIDELNDLKSNVIIWRLLPIWKMFKSKHIDVWDQDYNDNNVSELKVENQEE